MSGTLYLLPNRIADVCPEDVLPKKTLSVAQSCTYFLAENAKSARLFLKAIHHPKPIRDLTVIEIGHEPDSRRFNEWLQPILTGLDACIVSESGCPGVADPGAGLVREAHRADIPVVSLVGPCSILLTLMASGLNGQRFRFLGYLPIEPEKRDAALVRLENESRRGETEIFIETPYRNNKMLEALATKLSPETLVTVAIDVTGANESIRTQKASAWRQEIGKLQKVPTVFAILSMH